MKGKELYKKLQELGIYNVLTALKQFDPHYHKDSEEWIAQSKKFDQKEMDKSFKGIFKD